MDVAECPALEDINPSDKSLTTPTGSTCRDLDGDGTPDVFDFDNDGDSAPDAVDSSPNSRLDVTRLAQDSVELKLNGYGTGDSLYVDFELRPTDANADHLLYTNNVLDWPDNDREGQVTRVSDTTLSSLENFSGGKTANGDILLTPMLEVEIPAPSINTGNPSGGLPVLSGFDQANLADAALGNWLDVRALANYDINVSQSNNGKLYAFVPLILIEDAVGDTPVAWAGRMYYNTLNLVWGASHKVRLVWLVTAVVDTCELPVDEDYDVWCASDKLDHWTTTTSIVQTYYEKFHLTGLSVREHYGVETAIVAQTDAASADYENYLWHLSNGLERVFIGSGLVDGRRFDLAEIERRFDKDSGTDALAPERWGIPKPMLDVTVFSAPDPTIGWNDLVNNHVKSILAATYGGAPTGTPQVTLLFAREETLKSTTLDDSDALSVVGTTLTVDLGSLGRQRFASMNWSPYVYDGLSWVSDDPANYLGHLDTQMNKVIDTADLLSGEQPGDAALAKQGAVAMAKSYYMAHYKGTSDLVEFDDTPTGEDTVDDLSLSLPSGQDAEDLILSDMLELLLTLHEDETTVIIDNSVVANNAASGLTATVATVLEDIGKSESGLIEAGISQTSSASSLLKKAYKKLGNVSGTSPKYAKYAKKGALGASVVSLGALAGAYTAGLVDDDAAFIWLYSTNIVVEGLHLYASVGKKALFDATQIFNTPKMTSLANDMTKISKTGAVAGLVFDVAVAVTIFAIQKADVVPGSLAQHTLIANLAATIVVAVILAVIAATLVGLIIVGILMVIDALITLICQLAGVDQTTKVVSWVCGGITGAVTKVFAFLIHDQYIVPDLEDEDRLDITIDSPTIAQNGRSPGFVAGNDLSIKGEVENTISLNSPTGIGSGTVALGDAISKALGGQATLPVLLKRSAFAYTLQATEQDQHQNLVQDTLAWTGDTEVFPIDGTFPIVSPGLNRETSIFLSESLDVPVIECWGFIIQVCSVQNLEDTFHTPLGESFTFDVFPANLDGFIDLASTTGAADRGRGYRLTWDRNSPTLVDADGDGLPSRASGGSDPDDGDWDTDADGLSDIWEKNNGFDPLLSDPDNDGLADYWEAFYGTKPFQADTDKDGLVDGEEFFHSGERHPYVDDVSPWTGGWRIVYEYDSSDQPRKTLVSADPLHHDGDQDTILDKLEKVYLYNPNVSEELNVLSLQADIQSPDSAMAGRVAPGGPIVYSATIRNELNGPTARGLLESEFPVDVVQTTQTFVLASQEEITLTNSDALTAPSVTETTAASVVIRAGAVIEDPDAIGTTPLGRVLWLRMNERPGFDFDTQRTFKDHSGKGHDAKCDTSVGLDPETDCPDPTGANLFFDGQPDPSTKMETVVKTSSHNDFVLEEFSVSMWVRPTSTKTIHQHLFNKQLEFVIGIKENSMQPFARLSSNCVDFPTVNSDKNLNQNRWNHLAATYDGTTLTLYVNGQTAGTLPSSSSCVGNPASDEPIYIVGSYAAFDEQLQYDFSNIGFVFEGNIDDVSLYAGSLTSPEVFEIFDAGLRVLDLKFDEPPGAKTFADSSGNELPIGCFNFGGTLLCPESGRPGRDNQALSFGEQHPGGPPLSSLQIELPDNETFLGTGSYTVMAWVKGRDFSETGNLFGSTMNINSGGFPAFSGFGSGSTGQEGGPVSPVALDLDVWHHLAWRWDQDAGERTILINGNQVAAKTDDRPIPSFSPGTGYNGLLDHLVVVNEALSDTEIRSVMNEAPVLNLHMDEGLLEDDVPSTADIETSIFVDSSNFGNDATCTPSTDQVQGDCPTAGSKGQMREAPIFDGTDSLSALDDPSLDVTKNFSISLWVKPTRIKGSDQILIKKDDVNGISNFSLRILEHTNLLVFSFHRKNDPSDFCFLDNPETLYSNDGLLLNQWNHVVATFNKEERYFQWVALYINGSRDAQRTTNTFGACTTGTQTTVIGKNFHGRLDEITLYDSVLTDSEIFDIYNYQVSWYDIANKYPLIIDAEGPVVSLDLDKDYMPNGNTIVAISAMNVTSSVEEILVTVTQPSGASSTSPATPSEGDLGSEGAWLYTFDPKEGEGQYNLQITATDSVGNSSTTLLKTFNVEDTPPTASLDSGLTNLILQTTDTLAVIGAISDTGSAVDVSSVSATLLDGLGAGQTQLATSDGSTWQADFSFDSPPYGSYQVQVDASDNVGNRVAVPNRTVGTLRLDGLGPTADVALTSSIVTFAGQVISGSVGDVPYPVEGKVLHLHFEEAPGATSFADSSRNHIVATCTSCPTAGQAGQNGSVAAFDGTNEYLRLDYARISDSGQLVTGGFTAMAQFNVTDYSLNARILAQQDGTGTGRVWLGVDATGHLYTRLSGSPLSGAEIVNTGQLHHGAVTYDGTIISLYMDGVLVITDAKTTVAGDGDVLVGANKFLTGYFAGLIDDVVIYDRALDAETIYNIARPVDTGVANAEIRFRHLLDGSLDEVQGIWRNLNLASGGANFTTWQHTLPNDLEGPYKIDLRATDGVGNNSFIPNTWSGDIDLVAPRVGFLVQHLGSGAQAQTEYSFTFDDLLLDEGSLLHPCTANDLTRGFYDNGKRLNSITGVCQVPGHQTDSVNVAACDFGGGCSAVVSVPGLVGMTLDDALASLDQAGFSAGTITRVISAVFPAGEVTDQAPAVTATMPEGSSVNLVVSLGLTIPDNDVGKLATAITEANQTPGPDTIQLYPGATYVLTSPLPVITSEIVIEGAGAIIDGDGKYRVLNVLKLFTNTASLTVNDLTVTRGFTPGSGGGILVESGPLAVNNSTISGNTASNGGGISAIGQLTVNNSTISGNTAQFGGGGIWTSLNATLANVTITGNGSSPGEGGGIKNLGTLDMANTIVTNHIAGGDCSGNIISSGHNMDSDGSCSFSATGDVTNGDLLGFLRDNGGPTFTHALLAGNPAIDGGDPLGCNDTAGSLLSTDQRGFERTVGASCDIGAYESSAPIQIPNGDSNGLAAVIAAANANGVPDTIKLEQGGTYVLTGPLPEVTSEIVIEGAGATIGGAGFGILKVSFGGGDLTVNNLNVTGGSSELGGGLWNNGGILRVFSSTISGNSASEGGGIFSASGVLEITNSTISGNTACRVSAQLDTIEA